MTAPLDTPSSFNHKRYAASYSAYAIFVDGFSRPLFVCLLPVMICTLFLALQEQPLSGFLKYGTSIAALTAAGWTLLQLGRTPAMVSFRNDRVLIKSFLEASLKPEENKWHYVIDVKKVNDPVSPSVTIITYGHTAFEFKETDWTHFAHLTKKLIEAKKHYEDKVKSSVT